MAGVAGQPEPDDPYQVLGLDKNASPAEVTRAFRRLARAQHPDVHGGVPEADEEYLRVRRAYELLRDPGRRVAYDARDGTRGRTDQAARGRRIPVKVRSRSPRRGSDVATRVRVPLAEAVYGAHRRVPAPGGTMMPAVALRITPGTAGGTRLRLPGHGEPGQHCGPPGDLLVTVEVADHPQFRQRGRDLHTAVTVGYPELVLGADVPVEALDGRSVTVHVPAGTAPGTRLYAVGLGVPATSRSAAGDLIIETRLHIPTELPAAARAALTALHAAMPPPRDGEPRGEGTPGAGDLAE
jgi:DnaJ-class molecular chaperone